MLIIGGEGGDVFDGHEQTRNKFAFEENVGKIT